MIQRFSRFLDNASEFLAGRKGLLPLLGMAFVILNLVVTLAAPQGWLADSNLFLHLGVIFAILGMMVAWAL